ncbi:MAG TPA: ABC transporter permease, partial [Gemmatimonadales bacterium]|nr:ABC transporter permease [Gemmatimonadales bacterium]
MRHVKLAFRSLFRTPFVTAVAVVSLALGIGANAAIFSLFDQMLLQSLPVQEPERLINLVAPEPKPGSQSCNQAGDCDEVFSYPMFRDLERLQTVLTGLAAHCLFGANLAYGDESISGEGVFVSGSYFPTLGLRPALGRLLGPSDDRTLGAHFVTVLSHAYWQSRFGSDPGVLGKTIVVNGQPFEIVGVAPKRFDGTTLGGRPLVFVPLSMAGVVTGSR